MSPEKKVVLLFLSLIILMIACVYNHLNTITLPSETAPAIVKEEVVQEPSKVEDEKVLPEDNNSQNEETKDETLTDESKDSKEELNEQSVSPEQSEQTTQNAEVSKEAALEEEPELQEEVVEDLKPLITTDSRYRRKGSEKLIEELSRQTQELQIEMSEYVKKNPIIFKRGSNRITKKSFTTIKNIVKKLKEFPNIRIEIAGHTDAAGPRKLNQKISEDRALAVRKILINLGIDKKRLVTRGYGEDIPLVKNSAKGYSKVNRRVEFNIVEE